MTLTCMFQSSLFSSLGFLHVCSALWDAEFTWPKVRTRSRTSSKLEQSVVRFSDLFLCTEIKDAIMLGNSVCDWFPDVSAIFFGFSTKEQAFWTCYPFPVFSLLREFVLALFRGLPVTGWYQVLLSAKLLSICVWMLSETEMMAGSSTSCFYNVTCFREEHFDMD